MQQPPQGYGPPQQPWQGPPPKRGIGAGTVVLIIFGCLFSGCVGLCSLGAHNAQKTAEAHASDPASPAKKSAAAEAEPEAPRSYTKVMNFHCVHVNLKESEQGRAASLNKGESATFKGRIQGYVVGSVSVRDAELE